MERKAPTLVVRGEPVVRALRGPRPEPNAPQLIRLVRQPYAVEPTRNTTIPHSERPLLQVGERQQPEAPSRPFQKRRDAVEVRRRASNFGWRE
jgi:hypothetical protein